MATSLLRVVLSGRLITCEARTEEFILRSPKETNCIFLNTVTDVKYEPFGTLGRQRGYKVRIATKYGSEEYVCLFPRGKHAAETALPFRVIEEQCNLKWK